MTHENTLLRRLPAFRKYGLLLLFIFIACLLCANEFSGGLGKRFILRSFITAFFLSWPTAFLPRIPRNILQILIGTIVIAICCTDCYCQIYLGKPLTPQMFSVVLQTDLREAGEFFQTFVGLQIFSHWRITSLAILWLLFYISFIPYLQRIATNRISTRHWFVHSHLRRKTSWYILVITCIILDIHNLPSTFSCFGENTQNTEGQIYRYNQRTMPTPIHRLLFALRTTEQASKTLRSIKKATFQASIDNCNHLSPHIVLIIGESYNKHHASLYGYPLPTTPRQDYRKSNGELFVFDDVVTSWNITSNVFLNIFSLWESGDNTSIADKPLF